MATNLVNNAPRYVDPNGITVVKIIIFFKSDKTDRAKRKELKEILDDLIM